MSLYTHAPAILLLVSEKVTPTEGAWRADRIKEENKVWSLTQAYTL